jgi:hypothetical protein
LSITVLGALAGAALLVGCGSSSTGVASGAAPSTGVTASSSELASSGCSDLPLVSAASASGSADAMKQLVLNDQLNMSTVTPLYGELTAFDEPRHQEDVDTAAEAIDPNEPESLKPLLVDNGFRWAAYQRWSGNNGDGVTIALVALPDEAAAVAYANDDLARACPRSTHIEPTESLAGGVRFYERWGKLDVPLVIGVVGNVEVRVGACTCTPGLNPINAADMWADEVAQQFAATS